MATRQSTSTILARSLGLTDEGFTDDEPILMPTTTNSFSMSMTITERQRQKMKMSEVQVDELMSGIGAVRDTEGVSTTFISARPYLYFISPRTRVQTLTLTTALAISQYPTSKCTVAPIRRCRRALALHSTQLREN